MGQGNHVVPVERRLGDGPFLSWIYPSTKDRRHDTGGIKVRFIEYLLDPVPTSANGEETTYRLLTTILHPRKAPAEDLARPLSDRRKFETALGELQRSPRAVWRSKMPDGAHLE